MSSLLSRIFPNYYQEQKDIPLEEVSPSGAPRPTTSTPQHDSLEVEVVEWSDRWSFIMAAIGAAVGIGNLWRFPYLTYKHGGGAFLIPYFLSLFIIGIPLLLLELTLGQYLKKGVLGAFSTLDLKFQGIGLSGAYNSLITMIYYVTILAWSVVYLEKSFESPLPWENDPVDEFRDTLNLSDDIDSCSGLSWEVLVGLIISWIVIFICIFQGIKGLSKIVWITVLLPYILLVILFFRGVTLPGARDGIQEYLDPKFDKLFSNFDVWRDAATQILYSTGPTFGVMIAYANHVEKNQNLLHNALIIAIVNSLTSFFAGFVVWSVLGYMAQDQGVSIDDLENISGHGLAFIAFPEALALMPGSNIFSVIFFVMIFLLGVDSAFSMVEVVVHVISHHTGFRYTNALLSGMVCVFSFIFGIIYTLDNGLYLLDIVDHFISSFALLTVAFCEVAAVGYLYGPNKFIDQVIEALPSNSNLGNKYIRFVWTYALALILGFLILFEFVHEIVYPYSYGGDSDEDQYPGWSLFFGWMLGLVPFVMIVIGWFRGKKEQEQLSQQQQQQEQTNNTRKPESTPSPPTEVEIPL